jgi:proteasome lid subunit RPN8/RPN11
MSNDLLNAARATSKSEPGFVWRPRLEVALSVWQEMMTYVKLCQYEINGFGYIVRVDHRTFRLEKIFILDQVVTGGSADTVEAALHQHAYEMVQEFGDTNRLRFQWHSHVDMQAYFSGVDHANIERYAGDWMISLVANKAGEYEIRLDVLRPFRTWSPVDLRVITDTEPDMVAHCREEILAKVSQPRLIRRPRPVDPSGDANTVALDPASVQLGGYR